MTQNLDISGWVKILCTNYYLKIEFSFEERQAILSHAITVKKSQRSALGYMQGDLDRSTAVFLLGFFTRVAGDWDDVFAWRNSKKQ